MDPGPIRDLLARNPFVPLSIRRRSGPTLRVSLPGQVKLVPGGRWLWLGGLPGGAEIQWSIQDVEDVAAEVVPGDYNAIPGDSRSRGMTTEKFDEFLRRKPFVPFTIHTADGASFEVKSPEFASRTQAGRTIFVSTGGESTEWIDLLLVTRISSGVSNIGSTSAPPPETQPQT